MNISKVVGYKISPPERRNFDADIVENIKTIIYDYFKNGNVFHEKAIKEISLRIQIMIDELRYLSIISYNDSQNLKFFIRVLKYGSDFNFVVYLDWYGHIYEIVYR